MKRLILCSVCWFLLTAGLVGAQDETEVWVSPASGPLGTTVTLGWDFGRGFAVVRCWVMLDGVGEQIVDERYWDADVTPRISGETEFTIPFGIAAEVVPLLCERYNFPDGYEYMAGQEVVFTVTATVDPPREDGFRGNNDVFEPDEPIAEFFPDPASGDAPLAVTFFNESAFADEFEWSVTAPEGDPFIFSAQPEPTYRFNTPGDYLVGLLACNTLRCSYAQAVITVSQPEDVVICEPRFDWEDEYIVQRGDTLGTIARLLGVSSSALCDANCDRLSAYPDCDLLETGTRLRVPFQPEEPVDPPDPEPVLLPDLMAFIEDYDVDEAGLDALVIVENQGDASTRARLYVHAETYAPDVREFAFTLGAGQSRDFDVNLEAFEESEVEAHTLVAEVYPENEQPDRDFDNNLMSISFTQRLGGAGQSQAPTRRPPSNPSNPPIVVPPLTIITDPTIAVPLLAIMGLAGAILVIRAARTGGGSGGGSRKMMVKEAQPDPPHDKPCQPSQRYVQLEEIEFQPQLRRITSIDCTVYSTRDGRELRSRALRRNICGDLNNLLMQYRLHGHNSNLAAELMPVTEAVFDDIHRRVVKGRNRVTIALVGSLEGGEATGQFVTFRCRKQGKGRKWQKHREFELSFTDEAEREIVTLYGFDPGARQISPAMLAELNAALVRFVSSVDHFWVREAPTG